MLCYKNTGLRALELDDLQQLQMWRNNPDMNKYYREWRQLSMFDQKTWFNNICCGNQKNYMFGIVSIDAKNESLNTLVGVCGLTNINWVVRSAEISLYIGLNDVYIDSQHAPQALFILEEYAFNTLNMQKVWAEIYEFDLKKIHLFETFDLKLDGKLRSSAFYDGKYFDSLIYSQLREEFNGDKKNILLERLSKKA